MGLQASNTDQCKVGRKSRGAESGLGLGLGNLCKRGISGSTKARRRGSTYGSTDAHKHEIAEAGKPRSLEAWLYGMKSIRFEKEKMKLG